MRDIEIIKYIIEQCAFLDDESLQSILDLILNNQKEVVMVGTDGTRINMDRLQRDNLCSIYIFIKNILETIN